jgi:hypothetical protein
MECRGIKELIVRYSSDDIEEAEKVIVDEHIRDCSGCEQYFLRSEKLWDTLDAWDEIEPEGEFVTKFWNNVSVEEDKAKTGFFGWLKGFKPNLAVSGALATVFIVGIFTFALLGPGTLDRAFRSADEKDEMILIELDRVTTSETSELLAIYGPWDNSFDVNGIGGMN